MTGDAVRLLRPGLISLSSLEAVVGKIETGPNGGGPIRSPGQMAKHYSPRTKLRLVNWDDLLEDLKEATRTGLRVGVVSFRSPGILLSQIGGVGRTCVNLTDDPQNASALLYDTLHQMDREQLDLILVEEPPDSSEWAAIRDRPNASGVSGVSGGVALKGSTPGMTEHAQVTVKGSHSTNLFFGVAYGTLVARVWTFGSRRRRR